MGGSATKFLLPQHWKEDEPSSFSPIKYDPRFGFEDRPRELLGPKIGMKEMDSANLEDMVRDNCAHITVYHRGCIKHNMPLLYRCKGLEKELVQCYYHERVHDMKEFEREKRLNTRERRLKEAVKNSET